MYSGFLLIAGTIQMPPKWALGYHQCRWSYEPAAKVYEVCRRIIRVTATVSLGLALAVLVTCCRGLSIVTLLFYCGGTVNSLVSMMLCFRSLVLFGRRTFPVTLCGWTSTTCRGSSASPSIRCGTLTFRTTLHRVI